MQVSVETTQGLERRLTITVPAEKVDTEIKNRLRHIAKTQRIDGFRPGKVPVSVIRKRYGIAVRNEVAADMMQRNYVDALVGEKINPAGAPQIEQKTNLEGQDLEFVATFEVYPEVALKDLSTLPIDKPVVNVEDGDLDNMLETLRKQHATWKSVKRKSKKLDKVTMDFVGTVDGEEFDGGKAEDFELELGQDRMIPGFEKGIIGAKAGEEVTVEVTFPEDYHAENLKGKPAVFAVKLNSVEQQVLPEIDDEFATLFGVEEGGVDALKTEVRKNMTRELGQAVKGKVKEQVIKGILAMHELDLPRSLIDQEIEGLRKQAMQRFGGQASPENMPELPADLFEEQAKDRVKIGLLLGEVIKSNELQVEDDRVTALIENMASAYENPEEVVQYYKTNNELLQQMRNVALEEQAIDLVVENAAVSDAPASFDDIMNPKDK
ncbi:MAG: trigger factor [Psychrosphaera sp.]|nr:trigger factor [Psychrosphaera sp.]